MKNKRNKFTKLLKIGILLFTVSLSLWNCEKDPIIEHTHESINNTSKYSRTLINDLIETDKTFSKLSENYLVDKLHKKSSLLKNTSNNLIITSDTVSVVEKENYKSYTIRIKRSGQEYDTENLVIEEKEGVKSAYILSYDFDNQWIENRIKGIHTPPKGKIYYSKYDISNLTSKTTALNKAGSCSYVTISIIAPCGCGHYFSPPCTGSTCGGNSFPTTYTTSQLVCDSGGGSENDFGSPLPTTGNGPLTGGGGGPSPSSNNSQTQANLESMAEFIEFKLNKLVTELKLDDNQAKWVSKHTKEALDIYDLVAKENSWSLKAKSFSKQVIKTYMYGTVEEIAATNMTLIISNNNNLQNISYDTSFFNQINQYATADLSDPYIQSIWIAHFSAQCAIIKLQNPDWSDYKIYWEASKEIIHIGLDIGGMVPVVGEVCDVTNGVIYTIQGDGLNASLSFAAAIPIAGWAATGSKYAYKLTQYTINGTKIKLVLRILNDGSVYFGSSGSKLRKALGLTDAAKHAHHLIPWALKNHSVVEKAAKSKSAFHINEVLNGIPRLSNLHLTGHAAYNNKILEILENFNPNSNVDEAYDFVSGLANHIRTVIKNNPNLNSGQIANLITFPN